MFNLSVINYFEATTASLTLNIQTKLISIIIRNHTFLPWMRASMILEAFSILIITLIKIRFRRLIGFISITRNCSIYIHFIIIIFFRSLWILTIITSTQFIWIFSTSCISFKRWIKEAFHLWCKCFSWGNLTRWWAFN